jgi:hippurate hydrolase
MRSNRWQARLSLIAVLLAGPPLPAQTKGLEGAAIKERTAEVKKRIDDEYESLEKLYKYLHANPELSLQEEQTAARLAGELKTRGFEITTKVGGHGVVAVLKNGKGPTILVRCDMDALPVTEKTGLPYASTVKARNAAGQEVGVMHACGHDVHMTCWVGAARALAGLKDRWQGTLVMIAQPAEEVGAGARAMLADGLYEKFPRPDVCLALHASPMAPHGHVNYIEGLALANVDTVDIVVKGKGGHGAAPHTTIDPIVIAARIVIDLQTIISRERNPLDPAVVTVGSIHGGTKHNIIPSECKLQLTVRTTKDSVRKQVLEAIERIAKAAALAARAPEPEVRLSPNEFTPALINDVTLARQTATLFREVLGADKVHEVPPILGGEDFSRYAGPDRKVPIFMYFLGTVASERVADAAKGGPPLPSMHSELYAPVPEPSIRTGVLTLTLAVLNQMAR